MPFKKLKPSLLETLANLKFEEPTAFQEKVIPKIKSGANIFGIAPEGSGKTMAIIISVLQKLKNTSEGDNPRAIVFVKDKKTALELEEKFKKFTKYSDIRTYSVVEEHHIYNQKEMIYIGIDLVISTPKRLNKLYFQNGINLTQLELIVIDDANFLNGKDLLADINRVSESMKKIQHVVFATHFGTKVEQMKKSFMYNAITVKG